MVLDEFAEPPDRPVALDEASQSLACAGRAVTASSIAASAAQGRAPAPAWDRAPGAPAWELAQRVLAIPLLVFLLPVMIAAALAVLLQDNGPVFFSHRRIGQGGMPFGCIKFRTMRVDAEARLSALLSFSPAAREEWARDQKLREDPRVTPLGRWLRTTSLDELPQLINVLRGEMNLVGPRPIVEAEIARYGGHFRHYRSVKPGITGLWQVSGRNDVSYRHRVALDVLYARRRSPTLDLWILIRTVPAVLRRQGSC